MSDLPRGWAVAKLAEMTAPKGEKAIPSDLAEMPFIGLEEVEPHTGRIIAMQTTAGLKSAVALFRKGDLLYGRLRPYLNKVVLAEIEGAASAEFIVLPPSKALDQRYLQHVLMSPAFVAFTGQRSTGDRPRVSFDGISDYEVSLPPLPEQGRIVAWVDSLTAKSARARDHLHHLPRLVDKYKQAVLTAAFQGDLTREWRKSAGIVDGVPIEAEIKLPYREVFVAPSSWKLRSFSEVCEIQGGSQPPLQRQQPLKHAAAPRISDPLLFKLEEL